MNFYEDVGDAPLGKTFDRIDNNGNYEPSNWRWATPLEQGGNRRDNRLLTFKGETLPINRWRLRFGLDYTTINKRLKAGLPIEMVLKKGSLSALSPSQEAELKILILQGVSYRVLMKKFNISKGRVSKRARKYRGTLTQEQVIEKQLEARTRLKLTGSFSLGE